MIKDANVYFDEIYHKYVFAYRKYHGCDSALLSLTEQWKKEIEYITILTRDPFEQW